MLRGIDNVGKVPALAIIFTAAWSCWSYHHQLLDWVKYVSSVPINIKLAALSSTMSQALNVCVVCCTHGLCEPAWHQKYAVWKKLSPVFSREWIFCGQDRDGSCFRNMPQLHLPIYGFCAIHSYMSLESQSLSWCMVFPSPLCFPFSLEGSEPLLELSSLTHSPHYPQRSSSLPEPRLVPSACMNL